MTGKHERSQGPGVVNATEFDPIYLAMDANSGHGIGSALSNRMSQRADLYAFLFDQLGMRYTPH